MAAVITMLLMDGRGHMSLPDGMSQFRETGIRSNIRLIANKPQNPDSKVIRGAEIAS